jgi:WD40 repeat protein
LLDVDVSDDGRIVAGAGVDPNDRPHGIVVIHDAETRREIRRVATDYTFPLVDVSPDGAVVVVADGATVRMVDVATGAESRFDVATAPDDETPPPEIYCVFLRPGGDELAVATADGVVSLWDPTTGTRIEQVLPAADANIIGFAPDGTLGIAQPEGAIVLWDIDAAQPIRTLAPTHPESGALYNLAFSADGRHAAAYEYQGVLHVWDLATGAVIGDPVRRPGVVRGVAFSPTQPTVLAVARSTGEVNLYDVAEETTIGDALDAHAAGARDVSFSADGRLLATAADDHLIGLWGENGAGLVVEPLGPGLRGPQLSTDGATFVATVDDAHFEVRTVAEPERPGLVLQAPDRPGHLPNTAVMSDDGSAVLVTTHNPEDPNETGMYVADAATGDLLWETAEQLDCCPTISSDGDLVITVTLTDGSPRRPRLLKLWEVATGELVAETDAEALNVSANAASANFAPDGDHVDVAAPSGVVRLRLDDLAPVVEATGADEPQGIPDDVPGTDDLVWGGIGGQLRRLDMAAGEVVASGQGLDTSTITGVDVSPDGTMVAAYHFANATLALYDTETLEPIGRPIPVSDWMFQPSFSADGTRLAGNGLFGAVLWDVDPDSWQDKACMAAGRNLTRAEWEQYVGDEPYRRTCPNWPAGG